MTRLEREYSFRRLLQMIETAQRWADEFNHPCWIVQLGHYYPGSSWSVDYTVISDPATQLPARGKLWRQVFPRDHPRSESPI